jgi:hypothetical protein
MDIINPQFDGPATASESRDNNKRRLDEMILNDQRNIAKLKKEHAYLTKKIKEVPPHLQKTYVCSNPKSGQKDSRRRKHHV